MIEIKNLSKIYKLTHQNSVRVLEDLSFEISRGSFVGLVGKSGSGKSTLLNILAGLDFPTAGEYWFDGRLMKSRNRDMAEFRRNNVSMIVQNFALINELTVGENIMLPLKYTETVRDTAVKRELVHRVAAEMGIEALLDQYPSRISGGEKQRTAIARAIITEPKLLLADEPTASLDEANKCNILEILRELNQKGMTVLLASHDRNVYEHCDYCINL